jgi:hypothetical protein
LRFAHTAQEGCHIPPDHLPKLVWDSIQKTVATGDVAGIPLAVKSTSIPLPVFGTDAGGRYIFQLKFHHSWWWHEDTVWES